MPEALVVADRIYVRDSYEVKDDLKKLGYRYDPDYRAWYKPVYRTVQYLKEARQELEKLRALGIEVRKVEAFLKELEREIDREVSKIPVPPGLNYKRYQLEFIQHAIKHPYCLLADEMGLGKTVQAIGVMNALKPDRVLIFCPAFLRLNWQAELKRWLAYDIPVYVLQSGKDLEAVSEDRGIFVVSYDLASKMPDARYDLAVFDEAHMVKNPSAARTYHALKTKAERLLFLTGTPVMNDPTEIVPVLARMERPEMFRDKDTYKDNIMRHYWSFAYKYCYVEKNDFGTQVKGVRNAEALRTYLSRYMVRRTKKEVLSELPPKIRSVVLLDSKGMQEYLNKERELLLRQRRKSETALQEGEKEILNVSGLSLEEHIKALQEYIDRKKDDRGMLFLVKHLVELKKVKFAAEYITDILEESKENRLVVFTWHKDVAEYLTKELSSLGGKVFLVTSETEGKKRQEYVQEFQSEDGELKIFISTIKAGGVGLTLTRAKKVVFVGMSYVPADLLQAEDRTHRIGQDEPVNIYYLVYSGSVEEDIFEVLEGKQNMISRIMSVGDEFTYERLNL